MQLANTYVFVNDVKPVFRKSCIPVKPVQYLNAKLPNVFIRVGKDDKLVVMLKQ